MNKCLCGKTGRHFCDRSDLLEQVRLREIYKRMKYGSLKATPEAIDQMERVVKG